MNAEAAATIQALAHAIQRILRHREFLGCQLSYAKGLVSDEQMEEIMVKYLNPRSLTPEQIREEASLLLRYVTLDVEELAAALDLDVGYTMDAMKDWEP